MAVTNDAGSEVFGPGVPASGGVVPVGGKAVPVTLAAEAGAGDAPDRSGINGAPATGTLSPGASNAAMTGAKPSAPSPPGLGSERSVGTETGGTAVMVGTLAD